MIFNNGNGRTGGNYSTIEIINPPVGGFTYTPTIPYLPNSTSWIYNSSNTNSLYAQNISGAQQLYNGNVIFCNGPTGVFSEINSSGTKLWEYVNPVNATGIINQSVTPTANLAFRCSFYANSYAGFATHTLTPTSTIENINSNTVSCILAISINESDIQENAIQVYPNPTNKFLNIKSKNDLPNILQIEIMDNLGRILYNKSEVTVINSYSIDISEYPKGLYFAVFKFKTGLVTKKIIIE